LPLFGVAQDYPLHLCGHQRAGVRPWANGRAIWPTLATGVASTCIAYVTFLFSGVDGLQQLAVFTIVGLGVAALTTRLLLPALIDPAPRDAADSVWLGRCWERLARWPRLRGGAVLAIALLAAAVAALAPGSFWQNDLGRLTPVPPAALARDAQLRTELLRTDLEDTDFATEYQTGSAFATPAYIENVNQDLDYTTLRIGVNYRF